jgi:cytoplasmic iron level regulating protein YaaA (DUF328/UPF0246 family)
MLMLISPAKTLDTSSPLPAHQVSRPDFLALSAELAALLQQKSPQELAELMGLSDKLATLNFQRYQDWTVDFTSQNARPALYTFMGDVYEGLDAASLAPAQITYLDQHLRILSGLYGLLRPLDLLQPYRLEMGTALENSRGRDLYAFWGSLLTEAIRSLQPPAVVNLASNEYFKAIQPAKLDCPVITPVFEDWSGGKYRIVSFYAKRARGLMVRWAALHAVIDPMKLKDFDLEGYSFDEKSSAGGILRFRRRLS